MTDSTPPSSRPSGPPSTTPTPPKTARWTRYVAIGDSFTEGMCDDDPQLPHDGEFAGWADRLAAHLSSRAAAGGEEFGYANLAVRGRKLDDIVGPQLEAALDLSPDLVSIVGGGNDILRPKADLSRLADELEQAVATIRATGADVLMATPVDPADAPLVKATRNRAAVHTANIWSIARRQGAHVIDQWGLVALRDWRMWSTDRIHMTSEGHRRVALAALEALGINPDDFNPVDMNQIDMNQTDLNQTDLNQIDADWRTPLPPAPALGRREALSANAEWARDYVGPWVQRRLTGKSSGDHRTAKRPTLGPL